MIGGLHTDEGVALRNDFGASKHFVSGIKLFTGSGSESRINDPGAANLTFDTTAAITITSRVVGTAKFIAFNIHWRSTHHHFGWCLQRAAPALQSCFGWVNDTIYS